MQGFRIHIETQDDLTGIRFRLYDNDELVVDDIGVLDFQYLVPNGYTDDHTLTLTYFKEMIPGVESTPQVILSENFTLPALILTVTVEPF